MRTLTCDFYHVQSVHFSASLMASGVLGVTASGMQQQQSMATASDGETEPASDSSWHAAPGSARRAATSASGSAAG